MIQRCGNRTRISMGELRRLINLSGDSEDSEGDAYANAYSPFHCHFISGEHWHSFRHSSKSRIKSGKNLTGSFSVFYSTSGEMISKSNLNQDAEQELFN